MMTLCSAWNFSYRGQNFAASAAVREMFFARTSDRTACRSARKSARTLLGSGAFCASAEPDRVITTTRHDNRRGMVISSELRGTSLEPGPREQTGGTREPQVLLQLSTLCPRNYARRQGAPSPSTGDEPVAGRFRGVTAPSAAERERL